MSTFRGERARTGGDAGSWRAAPSVLLPLLVAFALVLAGCSGSAVQQLQPASSSSQDVAAEPAEPEVTPAQYVLVIGDDSWEQYTPGKADLMMLLRLDFEKHQVMEVSVPRDTAYYREDGSVCKLNDILRTDGPEAQVKAVSEVIGLPVEHYVRIGFGGFEGVIDRFGGIEVDVPYTGTYTFYTGDFPAITFPAGPQIIQSHEAMALSRMRDGYLPYSDSIDMVRQYVDRQMFTTLVRYAYAGGPDAAAALVEELQGCLTDTDLSLETQQAWVRELGTVGEITVYGTTGPFAGGQATPDSLWLVWEDGGEGWRTLMAAVDAGEDPSAAAAGYSDGRISEATPSCLKTVVPVGNGSAGQAEDSAADVQAGASDAADEKSGA